MIVYDRAASLTVRQREINRRRPREIPRWAVAPQHSLTCSGLLTHLAAGAQHGNCAGGISHSRAVHRFRPGAGTGPTFTFSSLLLLLLLRLLSATHSRRTESNDNCDRAHTALSLCPSLTLSPFLSLKRTRIYIQPAHTGGGGPFTMETWTHWSFQHGGG